MIKSYVTLVKTGSVPRPEISENPLRTESVEGYHYRDPTVGESFVLFAEPLDKNMDYRQVVTSIVQEIRFAVGVHYFRTMNSWYTLERRAVPPQPEEITE